MSTKLPSTFGNVIVVVRSYNRIDALCELLSKIRRQSFDAFRLVVIEQSNMTTEQQYAPLRDLMVADARLSVYPFAPLGGPMSRNEGARVAHYLGGDIIVFMDDDDLPGSDTWLEQLLAPFRDPNCLVVTGGDRLENEAENIRPYAIPWLAEQRVMKLDTLRWQRVHSRCRVRRNVDSLRGGNIAVRATTLTRFGLWDECTPVEDDVSIAYRVNRGKTDSEYLFFDGFAFQIRRFDVGGGMDKRKSSVFRYGKKVFTFLHNVVAHYYPWRFVLLYPAYVGLLIYQMIDWLWTDTGSSRSAVSKLLQSAAVIATMPVLLPMWIWQWLRTNRAQPPLYAPGIQPTDATMRAISSVNQLPTKLRPQR
jgi:glycosyltransferase involved in cell wall biosynthesis